MDLNIALALGTLIGCFIALSWFAGSDAPFVATKNSRIKEALKKSNLKKGDVFYELGSGDGRVVLEAAKMGAEATGIEQSWLRILYSRYQARKLNLTNAHFIHGNIFNQNYSDADFIFIFLLPVGITKLEPKLKKELKPGALVLTQTFHFPHLKSIKKFLIKNSETNARLGPNQLEGDFCLYKF